MAVLTAVNIDGSQYCQLSTRAGLKRSVSAPLPPASEFIAVMAYFWALIYILTQSMRVMCCELS